MPYNRFRLACKVCVEIPTTRPAIHTAPRSIHYSPGMIHMPQRNCFPWHPRGKCSICTNPYTRLGHSCNRIPGTGLDVYQCLALEFVLRAKTQTRVTFSLYEPKSTEFLNALCYACGKQSRETCSQDYGDHPIKKQK